jgi:hypothetical protein
VCLTGKAFRVFGKDFHGRAPGRAPRRKRRNSPARPGLTPYLGWAGCIHPAQERAPQREHRGAPRRELGACAGARPAEKKEKKKNKKSCCVEATVAPVTKYTYNTNRGEGASMGKETPRSKPFSDRGEGASTGKGGRLDGQRG